MTSGGAEDCRRLAQRFEAELGALLVLCLMLMIAMRELCT